jgi:hypothetical protein
MTQIRRWSAALAALAAFSLGAWVALHHPLSRWTAALAFAAICAAAFVRAGAGFFLLGALLPLAGLASWTGWIILDEFDLLVLAVVAGRFAAMAVDPRPRATRIPAASVALIAAFGVSLCFSAVRGFVAAGARDLDWFAGYFDALNSFRVAKPFLLAALTLVTLRHAIAAQGERIVDRLLGGGAAGLAACSLAIVWERAAFVGLFDFSSNYRATALFWEMHVGGAALDGFLALTVPLAVREWVRARTPLAIAVTGALMIAAGYACLVTFSRAVYLAVPISIAALLLLRSRHGSLRAVANAAIAGGIRGTAMVAIVVGAAWLSFRNGGYRGLIAVLGAAAMALPLAAPSRVFRAPRTVVTGAAGACLAVIAVAAALHVPKAAYVVYGLVFALAAAAVAWCRVAQTDAARSAAVAAMAALGVAAAGVGLYWSGAAAALDAGLALTLLWASIALHARASMPLWRDDPRSLALVAGTAVLLSGVVAVFSGGAYMEGRLAASKADLAVRIAHWRQVARLLRAPDDWLFGSGLGRFPAAFLYGDERGGGPGSYRLVTEGAASYLVLSGPRRADTSGDWLRIAQRLPAVAPGEYRVTLDARAERPAVLQIEICEKHLLYAGGCAADLIELRPTYPSWQALTLRLDGRHLSGGPWYAPRLALFSISVWSVGRRVEIDNVGATRDGGRALIANGDFAAGMSRWFFTSDNEHLPFHAKNIALNVVFDQGVVGLLAFAALIVGAVWRLAALAGDRPEAPFIAASITGFVAVGVFDSLLDAPRVAYLFYLLALLALVLPRAARNPRRAHGAGRSRTAVGSPLYRTMPDCAATDRQVARAACRLT